MAKAGLLFVGTSEGVVLFSDPGGVGRWLRIGHELRERAIHAIWLAADNPLVVLAALGEGGLLRSDDGGQSWRQTLDAEVYTIAGGDRSSANRMYSCSSAGMVVRSDDGGETWQACTRASWAASKQARLIVAHADAQTLYLAPGDGSVWLSRSGGEEWARFGSSLPAGSVTLVEDRAAPGALYALAGGGLWYCADGASEWLPIEAAPADPHALVLLAGKQPALVMAPEHGLIRSEDGGVSWTSVGEDVAWEGAIATLTAVSYHIDTVLAGSAVGQLAESSDRGRSWHILKTGLGSIRCIAASRLI
jgi:photosystem II stability/assembly factor-like uncharacterized protein